MPAKGVWITRYGGASRQQGGLPAEQSAYIRKETEMKLIDISRCAQEAPIYPGSSLMEVDQVYDMKKGAPFNASMITTGSHMGTHADAYRHFLIDNDISIDQMELYRYYGSCRVITLPESTLIQREALEGRIDGCQRLAIHGGGFSYLTKEAAEYIIEKGILTLVIDAWSVAPLDNEAEIHGILLTGKVAIVENVVLDGVENGEYTLCAFPMKIGGCDGAPVRAVLIAQD
jgi:arylformamidase